MIALLAASAAAQGAPDANARAAAMAAGSARVSEAMEYLQEWAGTISDAAIREATESILKEPRLTVFSRWKGREQELYRKLKEAKLAGDGFALPPGAHELRAPQPYRAAPGGAYEGGHHGYPGGLAVHTRANLYMAIQYESAYEKFYGGGAPLETDVLVAAPIWHDLGKVYVFQWQADGSSLLEPGLAGTGAHHVYGIAEAIHRGMPPLLVLAIAAAHSPADDGGAAALDGYLRAAEIVAGKPSGVTAALKRRLEPFINHFADGDWRYTGTAQARVVDALRAKLGSQGEFNWRRNELGAKHTFEVLHRAILDGRLDEAIK